MDDTESDSESESKASEVEQSLNPLEEACNVPTQCQAKLQVLEILLWIILDNVFVANETFNEYRNAPNDFAVEDLKKLLHPQNEMG